MVKEKLQKELEASILKHKVPGASIAVYHNGNINAVSAGILNIETRVKTTKDSLFQIGSITKPITAFMMLQLVEKGLVDLDASVSKYLPELKLAGKKAPDTITVRHLLTHQSGIDGDYWIDTGWGDDCLEKYVAQCNDIPLLFESGELVSYSNCGFMIAGRLIEKVTGMIWDDVLKENVLDPMKAGHSLTRTHELPRFRVAMGHTHDIGTNKLKFVHTPYLHRSAAPAGATLCMSACDLISFAKINLNEGKGPDGNILLSKSLMAEMHQEQSSEKSAFDFNGRGLGWGIFTSDNIKVLSHAGGTLGHNSLLRVIPEKQFALALLTNTATGAFDMIEFLNVVTSDITGLPPVTMPTISSDRTFTKELKNYEGCYKNSASIIEVTKKEGKLFAKTTDLLDFETRDEPVTTQALVPGNEKVFIIENVSISHMPANTVSFLKLNQDGQPKYLSVSGRIHKRQGA